MTMPNEIIRARPPRFKRSQVRISAEITVALSDYDTAKLDSDTYETLHACVTGHFVRDYKKYCTIGIPLKILDPSGRNYTYWRKQALDMVGKRYTLASGQDLPFVVDVQHHEKQEQRGTAGMLEIDITRKAALFFAGLKGSYTPNLDKNVYVSSECKYTPYIYQLLMQFGHDGYASQREIKLSELRNCLGVAEKSLNNFADFRQYVLEPAQADLEDTPWAFGWKEKEKGGANGRQIFSILLWLKKPIAKPIKKTSGTGSTSLLSVFWKKHEPSTAGGMMLAGPVYQAYVTLKERLISIIGLEGEHLTGRFGFSNDQLQIILEHLNPQEIADTLQIIAQAKKEGKIRDDIKSSAYKIPGKYSWGVFRKRFPTKLAPEKIYSFKAAA